MWLLQPPAAASERIRAALGSSSPEADPGIFSSKALNTFVPHNPQGSKQYFCGEQDCKGFGRHSKDIKANWLCLRDLEVRGFQSPFSFNTPEPRTPSLPRVGLVKVVAPIGSPCLLGKEKRPVWKYINVSGWGTCCLKVIFTLTPSPPLPTRSYAYLAIPNKIKITTLTTPPIHYHSTPTCTLHRPHSPLRNLNNST